MKNYFSTEPQLPLGFDNFEDLRSSNAVYVDKTALIYDLAKNKAFYFLARPRRFGKTLLLSTIASLFENKLSYFDGLAINKLWTDEQSYIVIRLNFAQVSCQNGTIDNFRIKFETLLRTSLEEAGFVLPKKNEVDTISSRFKQALNGVQNSKIVLLIDEYDAPLNSALNNKELFELIRAELNDFYVIIKEISYCLRFLFITGICKYKNLNIFSATNFITDISLFARYGELLGYTKQDLCDNFSKFITHASSILNLSEQDCLERLRINYDGNCFDEEAKTHVYTPWSVLSFFKYPERGFKNYWYTSGGNASVLLNYIKDNSLSDPGVFVDDQVIKLDDLDSCQELSHINELSLLVQTGYLTIKDKLSETLYLLSYPNLEVSNSLLRLYGDKFVSTKIQRGLFQKFLKGDPDDIICELNCMLLSIPYHNFKIKDEHELNMLIGCSLKSCGLLVELEHANAHGRSDIEVTCANRLFILELKFARPDDDAEKLLANAVTQINDKHYGEQLSPDLAHIKMALVYSASCRKIILSKVF